MDAWHTWTPYVQLGFAGFAFALLGIIVWLIRQLLVVLEKTTDVVAGNTEALRTIVSSVEDSRKALESFREQFLARPCIAKVRDARCNNED
jgi:hypothetical protein